ncbi:AraC family transcriptional regulator [Verrucomicrobia bacterium LW23]|nr:AraC family transcriptional regulator [Verrucomicrobia bacterium LW23]
MSASPSPDSASAGGTQLRLHDWASLRSELIWIYDHPPRVAHLHSDHTHSLGHRAWFMRRGGVRAETPAGVWVAEAGQWFITPAAPLRQDFTDDAHLLSVHFLCQWPTGEDLFRRERGIVLNGKDFPRMEETASALAALVRRRFPQSEVHYAFRHAGYLEFLEFQGLFTQWLAAWFAGLAGSGAGFTHFRHGEDRIKEAVRRLNDAPLDRPIPKEELVREAGLSAVHLERLFVRELGSTMRRYWELRRVEHARMCLGHSTLPIKEIAFGLGFRYDSHFVAWFRRQTGLSPLEYRKAEKARDQ